MDQKMIILMKIIMNQRNEGTKIFIVYYLINQPFVLHISCNDFFFNKITNRLFLNQLIDLLMFLSKSGI